MVSNRRRGNRRAGGGDLFTHLGNGPAITANDILGPAIAAEEILYSSALSPAPVPFCIAWRVCSQRHWR
ncbi:MAG: hypothetical protein E6Q98_25310 [Rhodospirillaceae bacterium]|nr:MAG: hypothetical protein E6Q98_25310 [Rhodospirillaceae bacterium]